MDATTMHSITSIISQLENRFPELLFKPSDIFFWCPSEKTIYYDQENNSEIELLLHETGHALLNHSNFESDISLVAMERDAWDKAKLLAADMGINIDDQQIQSNLDTYRDWLHKRSTCPNCSAVGMQTKKTTFTCPACCHKWQVNTAITCGLRRYNKKRT
jgi:hypothetical protein